MSNSRAAFLAPINEFFDGNILWQSGSEYGYIYTQYGRVLDLNSGFWNVLLGHDQIGFEDTLGRQGFFAPLLDRAHTFATDLAEKLCRKTGYAKALFGLSGTDAVEHAIRIAWQLGISRNSRKADVVCIDGAYHGASPVTIAAAGSDWWLPGERNEGLVVYNLGFRTYVVQHALHQKNAPTNWALAFSQQLPDIYWPNVSAFIFEPIQGVGGVYSIRPECYRTLADACQSNDGIVIADEVTTGCGRTGTFLASENFDPKPDIVCLAKCITNGITPLSVTLISERVWGQMEQTSSEAQSDVYLFSRTYAGNPTACMVASQVIDRIEVVLPRIREVGQWLGKQLDVLAHQLTRQVVDVRGHGFMWLVQLVPQVSAHKVRQTILEQFKVFFGLRDYINSLTIAPSSIITTNELTKALEALKTVLSEYQ